MLPVLSVRLYIIDINSVEIVRPVYVYINIAMSSNDDLNPNPTDVIGSNVDMSGKRCAKLGIST